MFLSLRGVAQLGAAAGYLMDQLQFVATHNLGLQNTLCLIRRELGHSWGKPVQGHTDLVMPLLQVGRGHLDAGTHLHSHWRAGPGANRTNKRTGDSSSVQPDENLHPEQHLSPARVPHGFSKPSIPPNSLPYFLSDGEG